MTLDETLRDVVRNEVRTVFREELRAALGDPDTRHSAPSAFMSIKQAADHVAVHPDTVRNWIKTGKLPEHRAGRGLRVRRTELEQCLQGLQSNDGRLGPEEEAMAILARRRR